MNTSGSSGKLVLRGIQFATYIVGMETLHYTAHNFFFKLGASDKTWLMYFQSAFIYVGMRISQKSIRDLPLP